MNNIRELTEQLEATKAKIEFLRTWETNVIALKDITPEQKIEAFDDLYSTIHNLVEQAVIDGYTDEDMDHWVYEQAVNVTLGREAWRVISALQ